jgi:NAD(P)-dependent dehydrogenase (short-subunit alcohol dehydrogenase family)
MTTSLNGTVAVVTGASGGLGAHMARVLARSGATVAIGARRAGKLAETAQAIEAAGGRAFAVDLDVTDPASVEAAFARIVAAVGVPTVLVNNAGIALAKPALTMSDADFTRVIETNLIGQWRVAKAFAQRLVEAKRGGSIVNIASIAGERAVGALAAYSASKAGLIMLSANLAVEWARYGIRVNAISPGYIRTDLNSAFFDSPAGEAMIGRIPLGRLGREEDLDGTLLLLASEGSANLTGANIVIDGGHRHVGM